MEHHSQKQAPVVVDLEKAVVDRIDNIELEVVLGNLVMVVAPGKETVPDNLGPFVVGPEKFVAVVVDLDNLERFAVVGLDLDRHSSLAGCTFS